MYYFNLLTPPQYVHSLYFAIRGILCQILIKLVTSRWFEF